MVCQLQTYAKEKDFCEKMARELSELRTAEQRLRKENAQQQLSLGVECHGNSQGQTALAIEESPGDSDAEHRSWSRTVTRDAGGPSVTELTEMVGLLRGENKQLKDDSLLQRRQCASLQQRLTEVTQVFHFAYLKAMTSLVHL
jgi:hypothetical protein